MHISESDNRPHRAILASIARRVMLARGLLPDFSPEALAELERMRAPAAAADERDLRQLPWCSIDNDDSRDLDQLTVAQAVSGGRVKVLVAVADVDALVHDGMALDEHARHNTTSVYTAARIFPMLPEKLSTDLTSLNPDADRLAIVMEMIVAQDGSVEQSAIYRARVHNYARLAYDGVAAWLDGAPITAAVAAVPGLDENLRLQDAVAARMREQRHLHGALALETVEARPVFSGDQISALVARAKNRAQQLIEDFMIGANGVTARYLAAHNSPAIRRVVREPKRWNRIVEIAAQHGYTLPGTPDAPALQAFLNERRAADALHFPDLSLAVIKLLGPGEYVAERPGEAGEGHFGLAVRDYAHSTAPNRRYTDLITHRLLKACLAGGPAPYTYEQLAELAAHCTDEENEANKVERQVGKSAAALLLEDRIGEQFDGIVTGAADKGTWVRLLSIPVEGRLLRGAQGLDVGDRVRVRLLSVDVQQGFIDFALALGPASREEGARER